MEANNFECRQAWKEKATNKNDRVEDHDNDEEEAIDGNRLAAISGRGSNNGGGIAILAPLCQAERCGVDLTDAKRYHRRHKVCEFHSKAPVVIVSGLPQRFCQQCSRFLDTNFLFLIQVNIRKMCFIQCQNYFSQVP